MTSDYHHGDLPVALRTAAVELIAERGPSAFSLREVARRAGVSHAAPAHHFGDARGLLTAVAAEGYTLLADEMLAATDGLSDAPTRLHACGQAYVRTALENPGHYGVMVGHDYTDNTDQAFLTESLRAYIALYDVVTAVRDQLNPGLDVDNAATMCWAAMHGLVELAPILDHVAATAGTATAPLDKLVESFTQMMVEGFQQR